MHQSAVAITDEYICPYKLAELEWGGATWAPNDLTRGPGPRLHVIYYTISCVYSGFVDFIIMLFDPPLPIHLAPPQYKIGSYSTNKYQSPIVFSFVRALEFFPTVAGHTIIK